jgi:hypothetical protein
MLTAGYPFWSLLIIAADVVALWGLCAYGSRENMGVAQRHSAGHPVNVPGPLPVGGIRKEPGTPASRPGLGTALARTADASTNRHLRSRPGALSSKPAPPRGAGITPKGAGPRDLRP